MLTFLRLRESHGDEIVATTMVIVLITIVVMGGFTETLLRWLGIEMGIEQGVNETKYPDKGLRKNRFSSLGKKIKTLFVRCLTNFANILMITRKIVSFIASLYGRSQIIMNWMMILILVLGISITNQVQKLKRARLNILCNQLSRNGVYKTCKLV